ncbi:MAG: type VI secretion system contractile sheath large subunit [Acidobacteria bacterium]|nr:MAG: type VI secretion system contractile sheath large subunit [Acidobacteriota bacterium]
MCSTTAALRPKWWIAMSETRASLLFSNLETILQGDQDTVWMALDRCISAINKGISSTINEILHHPDFKKMESLWLGLGYVVQQADVCPNIKIEILDLKKDEILEDFEEFLDLSDSGLFQHLYKSEYDQAGGEPYGCMLLNHEFDCSKRDLMLLRQIASVAASCHCPVIGNVSASVFGLKSLDDLQEVEDFELLFGGPEYRSWRKFREELDTRYVSLVLPRFLARTPYTFSDSTSFFFEEQCRKKEDFSWAPATYAFASLVMRSFYRHGWCIHIRGPRTGGMVHELPPTAISIRGLQEVRPPLEISFSDQQEHKLSEQGFIVLNYYKSMQGICVFSAPTLYVDRIKDDVGSKRFSGSLPYLFLVSRLAHYQKVIQREHVGITSDGKKMEKELSTWLKKLVTTMPNPDRKLRARYPLSNASVTVEEDPANPGFFSVSMVLKPHMQLEGVNAELTLISKLPRDKE